MFIYLIVNHETGKYYVGQHKGNNLRKYFQQKFSHAQAEISGSSRLFNSMRKHPDKSVWSIHALRSDIQDKSELDQTERDFIKFLQAQDPQFGYNICRGGEGFSGIYSEKAYARRVAISREIGIRSKELGRGFFGMTHEEHVAAGLKGGKIGGLKGGRIGGKIQGQKNVKSGLLLRAAGLGGKVQAPITNCLRWNIRRGKPCTCGKHFPITS